MGITIFCNVGSLLLGAAAWAIGIAAVRTARRNASYKFSVLSFTACASSLLLQLFEVANRVARDDFAAIEDTIRVVVLASCVLFAGTVFLNASALFKRRGAAEKRSG
ncbi:MAG: hypothetical protein IJF15_03045 [Oscillospiraceae bacterium]|nr:hypothetical protein [Oscillospiraceae bacterium]